MSNYAIFAQESGVESIPIRLTPETSKYLIEKYKDQPKPEELENESFTEIMNLYDTLRICDTCLYTTSEGRFTYAGHPVINTFLTDLPSLSEYKKLLKMYGYVLVENIKYKLGWHTDYNNRNTTVHLRPLSESWSSYVEQLLKLGYFPEVDKRSYYSTIYEETLNSTYLHTFVLLHKSVHPEQYKKFNKWYKNLNKRPKPRKINTYKPTSFYTHLAWEIGRGRNIGKKFSDSSIIEMWPIEFVRDKIQNYELMTPKCKKDNPEFCKWIKRMKREMKKRGA